MEDFRYRDERFADIQMLRYRLNGFEELTLQQKQLVFYLSQATLYGRDITFDQFGRYNLLIRKTLETIYTDLRIDHETDDFRALAVYLKRLWFSSGIHHHYGCEKFKPEFSVKFLLDALHTVDARRLPLANGQTVDDLSEVLLPVIFDPTVLPKRVNKADGEDLVATSACNYYQGVTQKEVEKFYQKFRDTASKDLPSFGLNSTLVKANGQVKEQVWKADGLYANAIRHIIYWLRKAATVAENEQQRHVIELLIGYYETGDLRIFDEYSIAWLQCLDGKVDFINGFIEVYGDPLGLKGSWEGLVEYIDEEATHRTQTISRNAQWFEDHSPVDPRFRKPVVKGVTANVICAAMLGGDEYPATAIGINLPNADWIRAQYGSKSITISNITDAYNKAAHGSGFKEEFVIDKETLDLIDRYGDICDDLHTDLHECLGHGSGQLLPGTDPDALKAYGNTIEEARADLFGLYYIADPKLVELGLLPDGEAYKSQYYTYMMNGLMTQLVRIEPGHQIEEAHMRNRSLIAHWCLEQMGARTSSSAMALVNRNGKTYLQINDYPRLRQLIAELLAEIQRIKSEGDFEAARQLVEQYAVKVDPVLHKEVLDRYRKLNLAPYKGFINPWLLPVYDADGEIQDILVNYSETYDHQMLRYSTEYATLI
ncbi:MAG: dihydrofolate reductase [Prevotella sp.]|nr:dihydrofolate reductase [Prevotella sp.]